MNPTLIESIKKEFLVEASQEIAFKVFTEKIDGWWPRTHHIGSTPMTELVLEPRLNGRWYTKHEDGSEVMVGRVGVWNPNDLLVLIWQVTGDFKFDPNLTTEVEVRFIPETPNQTRIKFEHKNLDRLVGPKVASMDEGWGMILELYKKEATR